MPDSAGDVAQLRRIAEQLAPIYADRPITPELPPFVKWFSVAVGALGSAALVGLGIWLVTSVSTMSTTLARMDERQIANAASLGERFEKIDERLSKLEDRGHMK